MKISNLCAHLGFMIAAFAFCMVNFADDITAVLASPAYVGQFLSAAQHVLGEKQQVLNREKTQALLITSDSDSSATIQALTSTGVDVVAKMKVLGVTYDATGSIAGNLDSRMSKGRSKVALALARLTKVGCQRDLHMCLLLLNADVRQTLLFGAALWGYFNLCSEPVRHPLQPVFNVLARQALGLPSSTAHWTTLLMAGHMPIQHWIIRDFYRFWNRIVAVAPNNALLHACMYVQATLAHAGKDCWLHKWGTALQRLLPTRTSVMRDLIAMTSISIEGDGGLIDCLTSTYTTLLDGYGDPHALQDVPHRRIALHYRCMWMERWGKRPWWHWCDVHPRVMRSWILFLAGWADVPSQTLVGCVHFSERLCTKCTLRVVGDEQHAVLMCPATVSVRLQYRPSLVWPRSLSLRCFLSANKHRQCLLFVHAALAVYSSAQVVRTD